MQQIESNMRQMKQTLEKYLEKREKFTGKIVFSVNCSNGGIGNIEAHIQEKI
jgi:hypothetical protein